MRTIIISIFAALLPTPGVAFMPNPNNAVTMTRVLATPKPDINHATYCADHFGESFLDNMDRIRNGE